MLSSVITKPGQRPCGHGNDLRVVLLSQHLVDDPACCGVVTLGDLLHDRLANTGIGLASPGTREQLKALIGAVRCQGFSRSKSNTEEGVARQRGMQQLRGGFRLSVRQCLGGQQPSDHVIAASELGFEHCVGLLEGDLCQEGVVRVKTDNVRLSGQRDVEVFRLLADGDRVVDHLVAYNKPQLGRKLEHACAVVGLVGLRDRHLGQPRLRLPGVVDF